MWSVKRELAILCLSLAGLAVGPGTEASAAEPCPNEALRIEQHSVYLPECRAYELVSPADKNGGDVVFKASRSRAAQDGEALAFSSRSAFADAVGTGIAAEYIAERSKGAEVGSSGWRTHAITPRLPPLPLGYTSNGFEPLYAYLSADLNRGIFRAPLPLTAEPYVQEVANLYTSDGLRESGERTYRLVTSCPLCEETHTPLPPYIDDKRATSGNHYAPLPNFVATSADQSSVLFETMQRLTANSDASYLAESAKSNLYLSDNGKVQLAGLVPPSGSSCIDPECVPAPGAGSIAGQGVGEPVWGGQSNPHVLSPDGRKIIFTNPSHAGVDEGPLYLRDLRAEPASTVQLNAPEKSLSDPEATNRAVYWDANAADNRVFFTTTEELVDADTNSTSDLYMWNEQAESEVQELSIAANGGTFTLGYEGESTGPLSYQADAAAIENALDSLPAIDGSVEVEGSGPFTVHFEKALGHRSVLEIRIDASGLSEGQVYSTELVHGGHLTLLSTQDLSLSPPATVSRVAGSSEDGHYVYFTVEGAQLLPGIPPPEQGTASLYLWHQGSQAATSGGLTYIGPVTQTLRVSPDGKSALFNASMGNGAPEGLYVYSTESNSVQCASCSAEGHSPTGGVQLGAGENSAVEETNYLNHALSDDGRYVLFSTGASLVAQDTNGTFDAYEYDTKAEEVNLLSSGTDEAGSYFLDASPDGHDVFIATRQPLVGWDVDGAYDAYDLRIEGGFPEPKPVAAPCAGEACRPPAAAPPRSTSATSASFNGPGNAQARRRRHRRRHHARKHRHRNTTKGRHG